jgi:hypothetical protein
MPPPPLDTPVDETLGGCEGAGRGCASTRPLGTEPVTSLGPDLAARGLEKGLSPKRLISVLQPAAPAATTATTTTRADKRERDKAGERMTLLTRTQLDDERVNQAVVNKPLIFGNEC